MQPLDDLTEALQKNTEHLSIQPDEFRSWKRHSVTQKLMNDIRLSLIDVIQTNNIDIFNDDIQTIAMRQSYIQGASWALDFILEWKPEVMIDEN